MTEDIADTGASASEDVSQPLEFDPVAAPPVETPRKPCATLGCHRKAARAGSLAFLDRMAAGFRCWTCISRESPEETVTRDILEAERTSIPELHREFLAAARAHALEPTRTAERAKSQAQRLWSDAKGTVEALELELIAVLARKAAAQTEEAREVRQNQREKLIALLERLKGKSAEIAIAIANLLLLWNEDRELLSELRPYFTPGQLDWNGNALGSALGAGNLQHLIETEFYRVGATARMPGADASKVSMDHRQNPEALPPLEAEMARIAALALARFDGVIPAPPKADPPRDPKTFGAAPPWAIARPKRYSEPPAQPWPVQPAPAPLALSEAEREAGYQRDLAEIQARANPSGGRNVAA